MQTYTGVASISATKTVLDNLYEHKKIFVSDIVGYEESFSENQYLVLNSDSASALARVKEGHAILLNQPGLDKASPIKPRNKEQYFALDALTDDSVRVVILTGKAGTGKTLMAISAAVAKSEKQVYKKIILTRPSSQVGRRELGILPGTLEEKFLPFLINYMSNFEVLFGSQKVSDKTSMEYIFSKYNMEIVPMQLLRGASFNNALVIADELQICDFHEILTLGTRISEGSKLVMMGDMNQRDEKINTVDTGMYKFTNDARVKASKITASIHMVKSERGEVSALFSEVFDCE